MKKSNNKNKSRSQFVTKKDLDHALMETETRLNKKIDRVSDLLNFQLEPIKQEINEGKKFRDSVLKTLDWLVGKFRKFEEELTILTSRYPNINDKLENHEERITSLEQRTISS